MCLSAVLGVGSALIGASSSKSAAKAQTRAAQDAAAVQQNIFDTTSQYQAPYREAGENALRAYEYELGLGPRPGTVGGSGAGYTIEEVPGGASPGNALMNVLAMPAEDRNLGAIAANMQGAPQYRVGDQTFGTRDEAQAWIDGQPAQGGTPYRGFTATPGYQFRLDQGLDAIEGSAAARGNLASGATLQALQNYGQDYATNAYENWLNRVGGLTTTGQNAAASQAVQGANFANNQANLLTQAGNARAAGNIGVGNAISDGIGNAVGVWQYQKLLDNFK